MFETLENRVLMSAQVSLSTLTITGSNAHDLIDIRQDGQQLVVSERRQGAARATVRRFNASDLLAVRVQTLNGNDTVNVARNLNLPLTVTIDGGRGNDTLNGGGSRDILIGGDGDDALRGGGNDNILTGGAGNDLLIGEDGEDVLRGLDGNDTLVGGQGEDLLLGGNGNDRLVGDALDTLNGETGRNFLLRR